MCMCTKCVPTYRKDPKRVGENITPPELELPVFVAIQMLGTKPRPSTKASSTLKD